MIDFRSDTVTRPTAGMRERMAQAEVGDDVYGEDPTVERLEHRCAELFGKESGLFVASGTMSNLLAIMAHCGRGDEYLVADGAHTFLYEGGGAAVLGSVQPQPVPCAQNGAISPAAIAGATKDHADAHLAKTRLLALENAYWGRVQSLAEMEAATDEARRHGLSTHLDGARVFNAALVLDVDAKTMGAPFDSVSICLSKGLGAPVGSVLVGTSEIVGRARRWRKVVGGGWRQAGTLAAAGLYALDHHVERLRDDHRRANELAQKLGMIYPLRVDHEGVQSNMVLVSIPEQLKSSFQEALSAANIKVGGRGSFRFVTHLDIADEDISRTVDVVARWASAI